MSRFQVHGIPPNPASNIKARSSIPSMEVSFLQCGFKFKSLLWGTEIPTVVSHIFTHFLCSEKDVGNQWRIRWDKVLKDILDFPKITKNIWWKPRYGIFNEVNYSSSDQYETHHINDADTDRAIRGWYDEFSWSALCRNSYYGWISLERLQNSSGTKTKVNFTIC